MVNINLSQIYLLAVLFSLVTASAETTTPYQDKSVNTLVEGSSVKTLDTSTLPLSSSFNLRSVSPTITQKTSIDTLGASTASHSNLNVPSKTSKSTSVVSSSVKKTEQSPSRVTTTETEEIFSILPIGTPIVDLKGDYSESDMRLSIKSTKHSVQNLLYSFPLSSETETIPSGSQAMSSAQFNQFESPITTKRFYSILPIDTAALEVAEFDGIETNNPKAYNNRVYQRQLNEATNLEEPETISEGPLSSSEIEIESDSVPIYQSDPIASPTGVTEAIFPESSSILSTPLSDGEISDSLPSPVNSNLTSQGLPTVAIATGGVSQKSSTFFAGIVALISILLL
ncbi:uncharacterized protein SAPINGB_P003448 [Magnusiomyces paraingens]|uniref:Uncharacterized protein n=1 Tax=Magnusiomyces paraingens TaxID=2606893 RepID=A0A5E8BRS3_9ASCO|nr:uncharacterized protein SAPINGB_P003448 [Saprochaete ingens]VVT53189.1 unnamed protein product [Saprochaete ingens]